MRPFESRTGEPVTTRDMGRREQIIGAVLILVGCYSPPSIHAQDFIKNELEGGRIVWSDKVEKNARHAWKEGVVPIALTADDPNLARLEEPAHPRRSTAQHAMKSRNTETAKLYKEQERLTQEIANLNHQRQAMESLLTQVRQAKGLAEKSSQEVVAAKTLLESALQVGQSKAKISNGTRLVACPDNTRCAEMSPEYYDQIKKAQMLLEQATAKELSAYAELNAANRLKINK